MPSFDAPTASAPMHDAESRAWLQRLRAGGSEYETAVRELHTMLLKAARFEVRRRCAVGAERVGAAHEEDLAQQSADDALVAVLGKLAEFRGESRFTTWVYKFALYEAAVKVRSRAWQRREVQLDAEAWPLLVDPRQAPDLDTETRELLRVLQQAIADRLSPHQREILIAVTVNDVPIDVLAERLDTTRGALYKTLHDARRKLRATLAERGLSVGSGKGEEHR